MCPADGLCASFRHTPVKHLALLHQLCNGPGHLFGSRLLIHAMLIVEVDVVGTQPFQRPFHRLPDGFWPRVESLLEVLQRNAELCGNLHFVSNRLQRLAHQLLIAVRTVALCRVEERHAQFVVRPANQFYHLFFVTRITIAVTHAHAAQPEGRHLQILT